MIIELSPLQIDTVLSMFPHFPRETIEIDLSHTGSVQETCDRILSGALVPPPPPPSMPSTSTASSSTAGPSSATSTTPTGSATTSPLAPYFNSNPIESEPPKKWEASPDARQMNLRQRKEFMIQQAR
eukprot:jgi/Hompol1/5948/HPOL_000913-RA